MYMILCEIKTIIIILLLLLFTYILKHYKQQIVIILGPKIQIELKLFNHALINDIHNIKRPEK